MRDIDLAAGEPLVASAEIAEAVAAGFGALLTDRDVTDIGSLEGGNVDLLRRGMRQRLEVILEGPLFALLREAGADSGVLTLHLPHGHELRAGPLADGRIAVRIVKAGGFDATLEVLVQEGLLPAGVEIELCAAVLQGAGVVVIGPARAARRRVLLAVARAVADRITCFGVTDSLAGLLPVPLPRGAALVDKARAAVALGADALCALDLTPSDAVLLARAELGVPFLVAIAASSMDSLQAAFANGHTALAALGGTTAVIGRGVGGEARLIELHGPTAADNDNAAAPPAVAPMILARGLADSRGPRASGPGIAAPAEVSGLHKRPTFSEADARPAMEDELPPLAALPDGWASDHADHDPGWELGDAAGEGDSPASSALPTPGSFDAALASRASKAKPAVAMHAPPPHPQAARLSGGDPFGGLTLEPPPGGAPRADDVDHGHDDDDGAP